MQRRSVQCFEIVTVGLPFCAFKVLTGVLLLGMRGLAAVGGALVVLGALDLVINLVNLGALLVGRPRPLGTCLLEIAMRRWRPTRADWHEVGVSADVMFAFALVALVIGGGFFPSLPPLGRLLWSLSTVLNVLGAGLGRLTSSVAALNRP